MNVKRLLSFSLAVALALGSWLPAAAERPVAGGDEGLRLPTRMAKDPLAAFVFLEGDLPGRIDELAESLSRLVPEAELGSLDDALSKLDQELGFSLRDELLTHLGPEYGAVVDLPPVDSLVALMADPVAAVSVLMENVGLMAGVRDAEKVDRALRALFSLGGAEIRSADGIVTIEFGIEERAVNLYYGIRDGFLALGMASEWVGSTLDARVAGERLVDGGDFRAVFEHLDGAPHSLTYVNLPKVRALVEESRFLATMARQNEELTAMLALVTSDDLTGMGLGTTSVEVGDGTRQSTFGPSGLTGNAMVVGMIAAIAVPNFIEATDRGKQKRTMADIRSIATAMEAYAVDTNGYPGPTDGWEGVEAVAPALSPVYIRELPTSDGWGHPFRIWSDGSSYRIVSPGKDGELDRDWSEAEMHGPQGDSNADIVWADGLFIAWPEGQQQ